MVQRLLPGFYTIKNKKNGPINRGDINGVVGVPVVAALSDGIWYIDHVAEDEYSISLTPQRPHELPNTLLRTREEKNLLFVTEAAPSGDHWYIRGRAPYYIIFKKQGLGVWTLKSPSPGQQVDVLRILPPLPDSKEEDTAHQTLLKNLLESESVSEDLFSRIPEEWLWDIHMAHVPKILWIGCSDARVPESVAKLPSTQIFVQRNIANQFHLTDSNAGSVLTYGLTGIKNDPITDIYVVGHSDCGGVNACHAAAKGEDIGIPPSSVLWTWLGPLRALADSYKNQPAIFLGRENVRVQVTNVKETLRRLGVTRPVTVKGYMYLIDEDKLEEVV